MCCINPISFDFFAAMGREREWGRSSRSECERVKSVHAVHDCLSDILFHV